MDGILNATPKNSKKVHGLCAGSYHYFDRHAICAMRKEGDPRVGDGILAGSDGDVVLVGFPHDEGVRRNGGRVGASEGPSFARSRIMRVGTARNPELDIDVREHVRISDIGDVATTDPAISLEKAHEALRSVIGGLIARSKVPFVIGGGNDQSYPNACGLLDCLGERERVGVINIDAHLDVRPLLEGGRVHSGSPFRQLLEDTRFDGALFVEFGAQGGQCSWDHAEYVRAKGGTIEWLGSIREPSARFAVILDELVAKGAQRVFVSFDIDSISGSDCPGVSCPATHGLSAKDALDICLTAGEHPAVALMDLSEFNPRVEAYSTGTLVANMFYYFVLGYARRIKVAKRE